MDGMVLLRRKQVVIVALIAMIAVAGYLNWAYTDYTGEEGTEELAAAAQQKKLLGEAQLVDSTNVVQEAEEDFFAQARMEREVGRSQTVETLSEIIASETADEAARAEAQSEVTRIALRSEQEVTIESLIRAKGFADAVVYINQDMVSVIVKTAGLSGDDAAKIQEIVCEQAGVTADKIKIVEVEG